MSILIKGLEMPTDGVYWCEIGIKGWYDNADRDKAEDVLLDAPTIIPAEEGER